MVDLTALGSENNNPVPDPPAPHSRELLLKKSAEELLPEKMLDQSLEKSTEMASGESSVQLRDSVSNQSSTKKINIAESKPKLAVITQFYPPDFAATGQLVSELVNALAIAGYSIGVYTGKPGYAFKQADAPSYEEIENIIIRRTRSSQVSPKRIRGKLINSLFFWLRTLVKLRKKDLRGSHLLITSAPPFLSVVGWFYHKIFGHTYTCLVYDIYPDVAVRLGVVATSHPIVKIWEEINYRVWRRANSLIVLSESMKQVLLEIYGCRIPNLIDKIYVIHNWADESLIKPLTKSENPFAKQHDLVEPFVVQYSGNLGRCHDTETILEAIYLLRHQPQIKFVFIGSGAGIPMIERAIAQAHLTNVTILPYQDKQTLPYSLTACDLALVSLKAEAEGVVTPSKVYGILAAGMPIAAICPPNSYLRSLISEAQCGKCISNGEAQALVDFILELESSPHLRATMGNNSRQYLEENFTLAKILPQYMQAIAHQPE